MAEAAFERIERIFHEALAQPGGTRDAFLVEACGDDLEIRREVERLLKLDGGRGGLLDSAPWKREAAARTSGDDPVHDQLAQPGARIGRYRLIERISAGGMGTVWLAERADSEFHQRVAIKLIKRGMDTEDILRRFRRERQVLAGLQHPNIARLLDGAATEDGRPYLVMEHIDGRPIDVHCAEMSLPQHERIRIFIKVCRAVQFAHRNLVIHRDLKPSNILVTAEGEPKLLDFGIAKLLSEDAAAVTATGFRVLTPLYASPEQVRGDRVTTASDVYALGVILYELLAGRSPYGPTTRSRSEVERAVLREEPARPSTAAGRRTIPADLDTIVLTALGKDPESRFGSPNQLADDLERFLAGRPILARPAGLGTRLVKTLRRNRRAVAAAIAGGAAALAAAAALSIYLFVVPDWVEAHLDAARLERLNPEQSNGIYIAVYWHDAGATARTRPAPAALQRAILSYDAALRLYPMRRDIRLERDVVLAALDGDAGLDAAALDDRSRGLLAILTGDFEAAFDAWSRLDLAPDPDPLVEGLLGILFLALDEPARAYPRLTIAHRAFPDAGFLCVSLADAAVQCGDVAAAKRLLERARHLPKSDDRTHGMARVEADILAADGRHEEAAAIYRAYAPGARGSPVSWLRLADILQQQGRERQAVAALAEAVRFISKWQKVNRVFSERADQWWSALTGPERQALLDGLPQEDPADLDSFAALLFARRAATLSLARAAPPVDLGGRVPGGAAAAPAASPSLAGLGRAITEIDLAAWVYLQPGHRGVPDLDFGDELMNRLRAELAGPDHALAPATATELAERRCQVAGTAGFHERSVGFMDVPCQQSPHP